MNLERLLQELNDDLINNKLNDKSQFIDPANHKLYLKRGENYQVEGYFSCGVDLYLGVSRVRGNLAIELIFVKTLEDNKRIN